MPLYSRRDRDAKGLQDKLSQYFNQGGEGAASTLLTSVVILHSSLSRIHRPQKNRKTLPASTTTCHRPDSKRDLPGQFVAIEAPGKSISLASDAAFNLPRDKAEKPSSVTSLEFPCCANRT